MHKFARLFDSEKYGQIIVKRGGRKEEKHLVHFEFIRDLENDIRAELGIETNNVEEAIQIIKELELAEIERVIDESIALHEMGQNKLQ